VHQQALTALTVPWPAFSLPPAGPSEAQLGPSPAQAVLRGGLSPALVLLDRPQISVMISLRHLDLQLVDGPCYCRCPSALLSSCG